MSHVESKIEQSNNELSKQLKDNSEYFDTKLNNYITSMENKMVKIEGQQETLSMKIEEIENTQINQTAEIKNIEKQLDFKTAENTKKLYQIVTQELREHTDLIKETVVKENNELVEYVDNKLQANNKLIHHRLDETQTSCQSANNKIDALSSQLVPKLKEITDTVENFTKNSPLNMNPPSQIQITCQGNDPLQTHTIPKFNGRAHNPNEFLNKLKKYYDKTLKHKPTHETEELLHDTIELSLEGHAFRWFSLIKNDVMCWDDFSTEFNKKYWNRDVQRHIKEKIERERYRPDGKLSRAEFFTERALTLQSITPPLTDEEVVLTLVDCFEPIISDSRTVQNITTLKDFILMLEREDLKDSHTRSQRRPQPDHFTNNNGHTRRPNHPYNSPPNYSRMNQHRYNQPPPRPQQQPRYSPYQNYYNSSTNYNNQNRPRYPNGPPRNNNQRVYPTEEQNQVCALIRQPTLTVPNYTQPPPNYTTSPTTASASPTTTPPHSPSVVTSQPSTN